MNKMSGYQWSDAWLLLAISATERTKPAELWYIIEAGDGIEHATFTYDELRSGLKRLGQGGWIKGAGGRFSVTSKLKKAPLASSRTCEKALRLIHEMLQQQGLPQLGSNALARKRLKSLEITRQSFNEAMERHDRNSKLLLARFGIHV